MFASRQLLGIPRERQTFLMTKCRVCRVWEVVSRVALVVSRLLGAWGGSDVVCSGSRENRRRKVARRLHSPFSGSRPCRPSISIIISWVSGPEGIWPKIIYKVEAGAFRATGDTAQIYIQNGSCKREPNP